MVVLAACGSAPRGAPGGASDGRAGSEASDRSSATAHPIGPHASGAAPGGDLPPGGARTRDCDKLISHALALGIAERPEDQKLTGDERATLRAQLRTSWTPKCEAMTSRGYDCALAATSLDALEACGG